MGHDAKEKAQNGKRRRCRKRYATAPAAFATATFGDPKSRASCPTKTKAFASSCCGQTGGCSQGIHYQDMSPMWFNRDSPCGKNMSPLRCKSIVYDAIRRSSS